MNRTHVPSNDTRSLGSTVAIRAVCLRSSTVQSDDERRPVSNGEKVILDVSGWPRNEKQWSPMSSTFGPTLGGKV